MTTPHHPNEPWLSLLRGLLFVAGAFCIGFAFAVDWVSQTADPGFGTLQIILASVGLDFLFTGWLIGANRQVRERVLRLPLPGIVLALVTVVATLGTLEGVARLYLLISPRPVPMQEFRRSQPPPYQNAPYFSQEFLDESFSHGRLSTPPGTRLLIPVDYAGTYFNVIDGKRRTAFQPAQAPHTLYLFGGSTVYSEEVPDEYTIASRLQLLINERLDGAYRVENLGAMTMNIAQQRERLQTVDLQADDIVLFYDGVNEILMGLYYRNPAGRIIEYNREALEQMNPAQQMLTLKVCRTWVQYRFQVVNVFFCAPNTAPPSHLQEGPELERLLAELSTLYFTSIIKADEYARQHNARFVHIFQPHLFTLPELSAYEQEIAQNPYITYPGLETAFRQGYPVLQAAAAHTTQEGVHSIDLTAALNKRPNDAELYFDFCHINHVGNQIMAEKIFEQLFAGR